MKHYLFIPLLLCAAISASGAGYKIRSIGRDPGGDSIITVSFVTSAAPPQDEATAKESWHVTAFTPMPVEATVSSVTVLDYKIGRSVKLAVCFPVSGGDCTSTFPDGTTAYLAVFASKSGATQLQKSFDPTPASATSTSTSSVHISGGINPAVGTTPTYTIDSTADIHPGGTGFGFTGAVKTDNRKKVDPDSFTAALDWSRLLTTPPARNGGGQIVFQGVLLQFNYAGVEFSRKGQDLNFVTAPSIALPFVVNSLDAKGSPVNTWNLELHMGAEGGDNFKNSLNPNGYGRFLRSKFGGSNVFLFRNVGGLDHIEVDSTYDVRLPYTKELFGTTNAAGTTVFSLSSKARHYLTNSVTLALNKYWGMSITHKYGSLPPTFNFVNHTLSIGLSYTYPAK